MKAHEDAPKVMPLKHYNHYQSALSDYNQLFNACLIAQIDTDHPPKKQAVILAMAYEKIITIEELYGLDRPF